MGNITKNNRTKELKNLIDNWTGDDINTIKDWIIEIQELSRDHDLYDTIDYTALPNPGEKFIPPFLLDKTDYPVWTWDKNGMCLTGESIDHVDRMSDIVEDYESYESYE